MEQFRCHVTVDVRHRSFITWFHDGVVDDNTRDPEVGHACNTNFADQDVPLGRMKDGCVFQAENTSGSHRIDVTVNDTK
jgi:hypothetical protein